MKFKLIEDILLEGKNIDATWEQYKDRLRSKLYEFGDRPQLDGTDEDLKTFWITLMSYDPTISKVKQGSLGDYGIWLTNRIISDDIKDALDMDNVETLLMEFTKKKSNLEKKDINQYKSVDELKQTLTNTDFSDRQKERQLRATYKGAEKVFNGKDWEIWVPETYEASCSLGKGSGWCTADSRTREHYDHYLGYGGKYYIIINKHNPKDKYQFHWESQQFFASGTCPQYNTPNEEFQIDNGEFLQTNKEVSKFFEELGYWEDWSDKIYYWDGKSKIPKWVVCVVINDGVEKIADMSFYHHTLLKQVTIPNSVKLIGYKAFSGCASLQQVTMSDGIDVIEQDAFESCKSLKKVTIPSSVTKIGDWAFWGCKSLLEVTIPNSVEDLGYESFDGCVSLKQITLPKELEDYAEFSFGIDRNKTKVIYK